MHNGTDSNQGESALVAEARGRGIDIRCLETYAELREVEEIQRQVWGMEPVEIVPGAHLRAVEHAGGLIAGAFEDGVMIGFVYGFLAAPSGRGMSGLGMHSHMLAVRHAGRGGGVGKALKWFQRDWCLARGIEWVCWTFDPLQAKNARLNMFHLGAISNEYLADFYGPMTGPLGGNQETDRLLALWRLSDSGVATIASGAPPTSYTQRFPPAAPDVWLLVADEVAAGAAKSADALAEALRSAPAGAALRVAAPTDAASLLKDDSAAATAWRHAIRNSMLPALAAGYSVVDFSGGAYALRITDQLQSGD